MALIDCPSCGERISDSAKRCPHCGREFEKVRETSDGKKRFDLLSLKEQKQYVKEFASCHPPTRKLLLKNRILLAVGWTLFAITILLLIFPLIRIRQAKSTLSFTQQEYDDVVEQMRQHIQHGTTDSEEFDLLADKLDEMNAEKSTIKHLTQSAPYVIVSALLIFIPGIVCLFIPIFGMKRQSIAILKNMRSWLKEKKDIEFNPRLNLTPRQQMIYDEIEERKTWL